MALPGDGTLLRPRGTGRFADRLTLAGFGVIGAGLFSLAVAEPLAAALIATVLAFLIWLWDPGPDSWRVPVYLLLSMLPVSTALPLLLGRLAGGVSPAVAWTLLWREALVFGLVGVVLVGLRQLSVRWRWEDVLALFFGCLVVAYTVLGLGIRGAELGLFQRVLGARAWLLPVALYFLGRASPPPFDTAGERDVRLVLRLAWFTTGLAFAEYFLLGDRFWQELAFDQYLRETGTPDTGIFRGVTANYYWFDHHGEAHRRWPALMGTLSLGYWYLAAIPILLAAWWRTRSRATGLLVLLACVALIGSRTRAAMAGVVLAAILLALLVWRKPRWIVLGGGLLLSALVALNVRPELAVDVARTLHVPVDPSALGHVAAIVHGTQEVLANPLGFGVGTAGFVGRGFSAGEGSTVGESLYLSLAAELGWLGVFLFAGWVLVVATRLGCAAIDPARRGPEWVLGAGIAAATLGFILASVTTEVWRGLQAGALYWWLLGAAVTAVRATSVRDR